MIDAFISVFTFGFYSGLSDAVDAGEAVFVLAFYMFVWALIISGIRWVAKL